MNKQALVKTLAVLLLPLALPMGGCDGSWSTTGSYSYNTQTGASTITISETYKTNAAPAALSSALGAGYTITFAVPTAELTSSSSPVQTTLTGTTDTGYTASITETITPAGSAPDSTYSGYTDYSYTVPPSQSLTNWVNAVNLNTANSATIVTATNGVFTPAGIAGNYSVYITVTSTQSGTVPVGSGVFYDPGQFNKGGGCTPGRPCTN